MSKFLAASRNVISLAVSLHLLVLRLAVRAENKRAAAAYRTTDTLSVLKHQAAANLTAVTSQHREAVKAEKEAVKRRDNFTAAAQAEADRLRRGYAVA